VRLAQGWTGTRDPRDPLCPRRREGRRASKNLLGFGMAFQVLDVGPARAAARLNLTGVGRGRRQGDTFIGKSWVPQRFRLVKEKKVLGSNPWLGDDAKAGLDAWDFWHARRRGRGVAMASEAARERKRRRARTPNRPGASSTGREPSLTTKPRLAGGTTTSTTGTTQNGKKEATLRLVNVGVHVLGCTGMRTGCMARACAHRCQDHRWRSERRRRRGDRFTNRERDGRLASCAHGAVGCGTC
jgi:hypothetical protein